MIDEDLWREIRHLFAASFSSTLHFSVASTGPDGEPWVTPVGSVLLGEPGRACYFEMYTQRLGGRLSADPRVCILAVDSGKRLWLDALCRSRFSRLPAIRLRGRARTETRAPTEQERDRMLRRVRGARLLPGGKLLWPSFDCSVRDIEIDAVDPVKLGGLVTRGDCSVGPTSAT